MRKQAIFAVSLLTLVAACGGSAEEPPVDQIVVREPGDPAVNTAGGAVDLVAKGRSAFAVCLGCHVAEPGAPSAAGPNLYGVVGRQAGSLNDFGYSDALTGSEIIWDAASLDRFLANPGGFAPGTSMIAGGVSDEESRAAVVAYLGSLSE